MTEILTIFIALTLLLGYFVYYRSVERGVKPNTTLWTLWALGSLLDLWSYAVLSGDWQKNILPLTCTVACLVLFVHFFRNGRFRKLTKQNYVIISADICALILWYLTDSALVANIALQISTILSFIPIYKEIYDENENETLLPWAIWSVTYALDIILVVLRWEKWGDLAYPGVNFVLHFLMWILIYLHFYRGRRGIEKHLFVKKSDFAGMGLFTSKKIKAGEVAFVLKGKKFYFSPKNKEEALLHPNIFGIDKGLSIDPYFPYDHINHRCEPNLVIDEDAISFVALRDINAGEELTFDYSISEHSDWEMDCNCGSKKCRGVIRSIEKLPQDFFLNYYPYIPAYFQKVYIEDHIKRNP